MNMINWLSQWLEGDNSKLIYVLILILIANILDFSMGWLNAQFNKDVDFSSSIALFGIVKKIVYFMLLVYFIPVALLLPDLVGITALYVLYFGYLFSEIKSVLAHLNVGSDSKRNELFIDFITKIFGGSNDE